MNNTGIIYAATVRIDAKHTKDKQRTSTASLEDLGSADEEKSRKGGKGKTSHPKITRPPPSQNIPVTDGYTTLFQQILFQRSYSEATLLTLTLPITLSLTP